MPAPVVNTVPLDAGLVIVNTAYWGATRGGVRFANGREIRAIEFDGKRSAHIVGHDRVVGFDPTITFDIIEFSATILARLEPGSASVVAGGTTTVTPLSAGIFLADDPNNLLTNFRIAWPLATANNFVQIRFPKAIVVGYEGPSGTDKNEAVATVTVAAALSGADINAAPYVLELLTTGLGLA